MLIVGISICIGCIFYGNVSFVISLFAVCYPIILRMLSLRLVGAHLHCLPSTVDSIIITVFEFFFQITQVFRRDEAYLCFGLPFPLPHTQLPFLPIFSFTLPAPGNDTSTTAFLLFADLVLCFWPPNLL